ncbi:MAG: SDR family oxidoreductase [Shimia sp.]
MSRVAVVAGGSAGVGLACVQRLLERNFRVAILARGQTRLDELSARHGDRVLTIRCDVSKAAEVDAAANRIKAELGTPKIWINSAMLTAFSPFEKMGPEEFEAITDTTYHGQVYGTRAALRIMGEGNIVNIGSGLSYRSVPYQSAYCGAKHAINGFTSSVRSELLREGRKLHLSLVQLPAINTPQFDWARNRMDKHPQPAPPIFEPDVAAKAVMTAIDKNAREIFVGKSVLQLIFGQMILPNFMDKKMADAGVKSQKSDEPQPGYRDGNLDAPEDYDATARGSFGDRAADDGLILDADFARKIVFGGGIAVVFILGLILG